MATTTVKSKYCGGHWSTSSFIITTATVQHPFNGLSQDNLGKLAPERSIILDFGEARDDGVAVASTEPYASHLHFAPNT